MEWEERVHLGQSWMILEAVFLPLITQAKLRALANTCLGSLLWIWLWAWRMMMMGVPLDYREGLETKVNLEC